MHGPKHSKLLLYVKKKHPNLKINSMSNWKVKENIQNIYV